MKNIIHLLCTSRNVSRTEIVLGAIALFFVTILEPSFSVQESVAISSAISVVLVLTCEVYWHTTDNNLAPAKFSPKNLAIRDIVIRYMSKTLAYLETLGLLLQINEQNASVLLIAGALVLTVLFVIISVCFFRINLKAIRNL
ncbi:hypothetical protein FACS189499_03410 [Clostridia bacterium]|nr:hypothetical protein FACS189499_03410 [Clostridia bacterium]